MAFSAFYRRPTFNARPKRAGAAKARTRRRAPPSSAVINAVLEYADLRDDMGGGRVMLRLSPAAQADPDLRSSLGTEAARLADLAVIWDEREEAVFRVLDGGPPPLAAVSSSRPSEDDHFILTPVALDYVAQSQSRRRG
jgi:hypothetical protein